MQNILKPGAVGRADAAAYLGISLRLLDKLLSSGVLPKLKCGRKTLIRVCDLENYLTRLARLS